jgi:hypothetical protein
MKWIEKLNCCGKLFREKGERGSQFGSDTGSPLMLVGLFATILEKPDAVKGFLPISEF